MTNCPQERMEEMLKKLLHKCGFKLEESMFGFTASREDMTVRVWLRKK